MFVGRVELTGVDGLIGFLEGTLCILFIGLFFFFFFFFFISFHLLIIIIIINIIIISHLGVQLYDSAQEKFGWVQEEKIPRFEEEEEEPLLRKVNN